MAASASQAGADPHVTGLWLSEYPNPDVRVRFDVIAIDGVRIVHWDDAF